jgi:hypothetical protein
MSESNQPKSGKGPTGGHVLIVWCVVAVVAIVGLMAYLDGLNAEQVRRLKETIVTVIACVICGIVCLGIGLAIGRRQERSFNKLMRSADRSLPVPPPMAYTMPQMVMAPPPPYEYARPLSQSQGGYRSGVVAADFGAGGYEEPSFDWGDM